MPSVGVDVMLFDSASPTGDGQVIQLHLRVMDMYCLRVTMIPLVEYITDTIYRCFTDVFHGMLGFFIKPTM